MYERYAIYWAPSAESEMAKFGRAWLGGHCDKAKLKARGDYFRLDADLVEKATASPSRYGLHATMKAPFRLADGMTETELSASLAEFCSRRRAVRTGPLHLHRFARYLAFIPSGGRADLEWLAAECVTYFDRFRAPLSDADRARRHGAMSALQRQQFEQFGYPYIFSQFFFHITLAGPLEEQELGQVEEALAPSIASFIHGQDDFVLKDLCLFGDPGGGGAFTLIGRYPFRR